MEQTEALGDYIATILAQEPTYTIEIPHVPGAMEELLFPKDCGMTDEEFDDFKKNMRTTSIRSFWINQVKVRTDAMSTLN